MPARNLRFHTAALLLLLIFMAELTFSVHRQSLSWDEGDHIFAGYESWKTANFGLNPEHPPLVKQIATLPLLGMKLQTPPSGHFAFFKDEAYFRGRDFLYNNGGIEVADRIIFRARMAAATLSLLMASLVYLAAFEIFGPLEALFALTLVVFEPNLIAHGAYVTTDMGVTCLLFATIYALFRYRARPTTARLILIGIATGLALAAKHSATLLLPIGLALFAFEFLFPAAAETRTTVARRYAAAFASALLVGLTVLWATYGLRFSSHPRGVTMTPSLAEYLKPMPGFESRLYLLLARFHILPESYLYGMADIRLQSLPGTSFPTYLFGQVHAHGVPYYFPAAFVIKSTMGFMLLLVIACFAVTTRRLSYRRRLAFFTIPPLVYLLIALVTGLNIGARHILPLYPFLAVFIAAAAVPLARMHRNWAGAVLALLAWHAVSTTRSAPMYLAYSNELFGGPSQTYRYLTDSNVDWGQQLHSVKQYLDRNQIHDCWFAYFVQPAIDFRAYGIPCRPLPTADTASMHEQIDSPSTISGTVLISAGTLTGYEFGSVVLNPYRSFLSIRPTAVIDNGVFVYNGTFDNHYASAFGHATRASTLFQDGNYAAALPEAQEAVRTDPETMRAQLILGDTLAKLNQPQQAAQAYYAAKSIAQSMEPSARKDWLASTEAKLRALQPARGF